MSTKTVLTVYDKTDIYEKSVAPEIEKVRQVCAANRLPFFFSSAVKNDEDGTVYKNEGVLTGSFGINLKDDHFERFLGVLHGGKVVFNAGTPDVSAEEQAEYLQDPSFGEEIEPVPYEEPHKEKPVKKPRPEKVLEETDEEEDFIGDI